MLVNRFFGRLHGKSANVHGWSRPTCFNSSNSSLNLWKIIFCCQISWINQLTKEIQTKILSYRKSESADINRKWSGKFLMYTLRLISTSLSGSDILSLARDSFVARRLPYRFRRTYNIETIRQKAENSANGTAIDTINDVLSWSKAKEIRNGVNHWVCSSDVKILSFKLQNAWCKL